MPGDAACAYFLLPGYLMVQCMTAAVLREPSLLREKRIRDTLERGLNGCTLNGLRGHGYEAEEEMIKNLKMFLQADCCDLFMRYPGISPLFRGLFFGLLNSVKQDHSARIRSWTRTLKQEQEETLALAPDWVFHDYSPWNNGSLYIAYGSNMDEKQMEVRCPGAELVGIGNVKRARLDFYLYADVIPVDDDQTTVPAAVWRITGQQERALDRYEGVPGHFYRRARATVTLNNGTEIEGLIYLMENRRYQPVSQGYYDRIAAAYERLVLYRRISDVLEPARRRSLRLGQ